MQRIGREFSQLTVSLYPLDKLFQIFCLAFLFFNFLLQTDDFFFEFFLFFRVVSVHHGKAFIIDLARYIVLITAEEQPIKFSDTLLSLCHSLLCYP